MERRDRSMGHGVGQCFMTWFEGVEGSDVDQCLHLCQILRRFQISGKSAMRKRNVGTKVLRPTVSILALDPTRASNKTESVS